MIEVPPLPQHCMEWLSDPTIWMGLSTLVVLEIILGIDNLVFIAILADKLPPHQRDKARLIGLSLALVMRLGLLATLSWIMRLTTPLFSVFDHSFSGRDLILLIGGHAQRWHLGTASGAGVTATVRAWRDNAPRIFPLPHPSWRNTGWLRRNPWFEAELLPELRATVAAVLRDPDDPA